MATLTARRKAMDTTGHSPFADTKMGGAQHGFPTTHWSLLTRIADRSDPSWSDRVNALAALYWKPIYRYIRVRWGRSIEEAKDVTQGFFLHILEGMFLDRVDPSRGRFRTFVKTCLDNYVKTQHRDEHRQKRGGEGSPIRIDFSEEDDKAWALPSDECPPEVLLDRQWKACVLERAVEMIRARYEQQDRSLYFEVFRLYDLADPQSRPRYKDLATRLGVSPADVDNYLSHARASLLEAIREILAESVASPEALDQELRELFPPPRTAHAKDVG